jgi:serine/threonine protein kinase
MAIQPGTKLGPYQITDQIGAGGMGEVYSATDTRLDRTVAIKVLPEHLADDPQRRERFEREAKAVSSLNHPHICTLYDVGADGERFISTVPEGVGEAAAPQIITVLNWFEELTERVPVPYLFKVNSSE